MSGWASVPKKRQRPGLRQSLPLFTRNSKSARGLAHSILPAWNLRIAFLLFAVMRPLRALILYILLVFVGGALLAPWLYWGMQELARAWPTLSEMADKPFHRFVNRSLLGLALLGLWPLLKSLGATSARDVGLVRPAGQWKNLGTGFLLGFLSLALIATLALVFGARHINQTLTLARLADKLTGAALTAIVVSVLEEVLFRGALFGSLRKVFHVAFALAASSMIYAIVHFMESAKWTGPITWTSGLELLPRMLRGFANFDAVLPGFFNLTLAGLLLGLAYHRTGTLYFSIGLHAGWIFWLKSYGTLTKAVPEANVALWGTSKLINGWLALPVLAAAVLVFMRIPLRRDTMRSRPVPGTLIQ